jgi:glycosyl transferase family 25|tara:strand:- start:625 stop:1215 length:591 start_codon:yes stop_codon:yes gene_type:complete
MDINILYINLDHRTDRKEHMERSLQGYNYERVSAIEDKDGYIGCAKSHIKCIEIARARKYQRVIILEDDFMFYKDNNFKNISLPETFDIFLLCNRIKKHVSLNDTFIKVKDCSWTSGHILNQSIYNDLIDNLETGIELRKGNKGHDYKLDIYWNKLFDHYECISHNFVFATQREGYSNIMNQNMKYSNDQTNESRF